MSEHRAKVGELCEQIRGVTFAKEDAVKDPQPGYVPVLRAGNIGESGVLFDDLMYVPSDRVASHQFLCANDVLIAASSGSLSVVGKAVRIHRDFDGGFGAFCKVLRPNARVDPAYFAHYFQTPDYRRRISAAAEGANINNLRTDDLNRMEIPLPPLPEQRRIAEILDRADDLRAKRRSAIAQLDTLTQSIFVEMFGDPASNPKGWPTGRIGDMLSSASYGTSEKARTSGEFAVLGMGNLTRTGDIELGGVKYMDLPTEKQDRYLVRAGDVLFNRTNSADLVGKTAIFRLPTPMAYAGYLIRLRTNASNHPEFLAAYLNSAYSKAVLRNMCKSIIGMANINAQEIQKMRALLPPLPLQSNFATKVLAVQSLKETQRSALIALDALFASLQHRAFQGEL